MAAWPDWALRQSDGSYVRAQELHGKVVLLDFWSSWYGPSAQAISRLHTLHEEHGDRGLVVLGICIHERPDTDPIKFLRARGAEYTCLLRGERVADSFGFRALPHRVVIDAEGQVAGFDLKSIAQLLDE